jgi:signal-transduction protein with cAMP-binding, CBS, and nucleotidyltransferase domain
MDRRKNATPTDFDLLNQLKPLFLSPLALHELATGLKATNFSRREVILPEEELAAGVHILLKGVAKITHSVKLWRRRTRRMRASSTIYVRSQGQALEGVTTG